MLDSIHWFYHLPFNKGGVLIKINGGDEIKKCLI